MAGFHALKRLPEEKITDKITRRVLFGDKTMIDLFAPPARGLLPRGRRAHVHAERLAAHHWLTVEGGVP